MTVGFPGTGIGGLFYIFAALLGPLRHMLLRRRSWRADWRPITRLFLLGMAVVLGIFATGWFLGFVFGPVISAAAAAGTGSSALRRHEVENVVRWAALLASLVMLGVVLLAVQVARILVRKK